MGMVYLQSNIIHIIIKFGCINTGTDSTQFWKYASIARIKTHLNLNTNCKMNSLWITEIWHSVAFLSKYFTYFKCKKVDCHW